MKEHHGLPKCVVCFNILDACSTNTEECCLNRLVPKKNRQNNIIFQEKCKPMLVSTARTMAEKP